MIRTVIVEDQEKVLESFMIQLEKYCPEVRVEGTASTTLEGVKVINQVQPDLVFLDVELPNGSGFDILDALVRRDFQTIFVTAHNKYAVEAFRANAIDYLLKPADPDELRAAVEKVTKQISFNHKPNYVQLLNQLRLGMEPKVGLSTKSGTVYFKVKEIIYAEAAGSYCKLYLENRSKPVMLSRTLKEIESTLLDLGFLRIHRSYLVNMDHVQMHQGVDGGTILLSNDNKLSISRSHKDEVLMQLRSRLPNL